MVGITFTPNLHLSKLPANYRVWAQIMNDNLTLVDAAISGFITFNNLRGTWSNSTVYAVGDTVVDGDTVVLYTCNFAHTSAQIPTTFAADRLANPTYWSVTAAAAVNKGAWASGVAYNRNDFVLADGTKYAFCLVSHTSGALFSTDLALGRWSVLVDLSVVGSLVLPVLSGVVDADKFVTVDGGGASYVISTATQARTKLGATVIGDALITTASAAAARTTIDAQEQTTLLDNYSAGLRVPTAQGGVPAGALMPYAGSAAPTGWLLARGQSELVASYPDLFAAIGYAYGGAGANFTMPDLGGRVVAGSEAVATRLTIAGAGFSGAVLGAAGGTETHTLTLAQTPAHAHAGSTGARLAGGANTQAGGSFGILDPGALAITSEGGGLPHQNTQPTIVLNYIIKT